MRTQMKNRIFGGFAAAGVLTVAAFGLTASNTVAPSSSGAGEGAVSGYTIEKVGYTLNSASPDQINSVQFQVASSDVASTSAFAISAKLDSLWSANCDTRAYTVGPPSYTSVTCSYSGTLPQVESVIALRVVVAAK